MNIYINETKCIKPILFFIQATLKPDITFCSVETNALGT